MPAGLLGLLRSDGCYSKPVPVDVPVHSGSRSFYVLFRFTNNDRYSPTVLTEDSLPSFSKILGWSKQDLNLLLCLCVCVWLRVAWHRNMHLNEDSMKMEFGHCKSIGAIPLRKNTQLTVVKVLPVYYSIQFDLTPGPRVEKGWANVIHFSSTGHDCCNYGDRIPAVWFYPGTRKLYVIDGHAGPSTTVSTSKKSASGHDDECPIDTELQVGQVYKIRIDMAMDSIHVFLNGQLACWEPRKGRVPFTDVKVRLKSATDQHSTLYCCCTSN